MRLCRAKPFCGHSLSKPSTFTLNPSPRTNNQSPITAAGRIFGGDHYNPYTNTINLYSDVPAIAIHEGGHAKDFAPREWKGTYAFFYMLPFAALYAEARASNDAMSYLHAQPDPEGEEEGYKILYPAYATYIGGETTSWIAPYPLIYIAAVIPGHIIGHWKAAHVVERREAEDRIETPDNEE